jgi:hypothetical protein
MHKTANTIVRWTWFGSLAVMGLISTAAIAQVPPAPAAPGAPYDFSGGGPIRRLFSHSAHTLQDKMIGYPDAFKEPPLGYYVCEQFAVQVAKADPHRFTLYRSDFLPGTTQFSPIGASRFNIMFAKLGAWPGPINVEWTPDQPALAQSRRAAVLATLQRAGRPIEAARVVIGPSPYPGAYGVEAIGNITNAYFRSQAAGATFALPPAESAALGVR